MTYHAKLIKGGKVVIPAGKTFKQTDPTLEGMNYLIEGVIGKA